MVLAGPCPTAGLGCSVLTVTRAWIEMQTRNVSGSGLIVAVTGVIVTESGSIVSVSWGRMTGARGGVLWREAIVASAATSREIDPS